MKIFIYLFFLFNILHGKILKFDKDIADKMETDE